MKTPVHPIHRPQHFISKDNFEKALTRNVIKDLELYILSSDDPRYKSVLPGMSRVLAVDYACQKTSNLLGSTSLVKTQHSDKPLVSPTTSSAREFGEVVKPYYAYRSQTSEPKVEKPQALTAEVKAAGSQAAQALYEALDCMNHAVSSLPIYLSSPENLANRRKNAIKAVNIMQDFYQMDELANRGFNFSARHDHETLFDDSKLMREIDVVSAIPSDTLKLNCLARHIGDNCLSEEQKEAIFTDQIRKYQTGELSKPDRAKLEELAGKDALERSGNSGRKRNILAKGLRAVGLEILADKLSVKKKLFEAAKRRAKVTTNAR